MINKNPLVNIENVAKKILFNKKKHIVNKEIIDLTNENVVIKVIENNKITI